MDVGVGDGLARGRAVVDADGEAVGVVAFLEAHSHAAHEVPDVTKCVRRKVEDALHVFPGDDEGVPGSNGVAIGHGDRGGIGWKLCLRFEAAERAVRRTGRHRSVRPALFDTQHLLEGLPARLDLV